MAKATVEITKIEGDAIYGKYLTFNVEEEIFGMNLVNVTEIISMQEITEVPEMKTYLKGIINLRGKIIPVIDIRLKFKREVVPYDDRTCILVIDVDDSQVGLIVDSVAEVLDITNSNISDPPNNITGFANKYLEKIGKTEKNVILVLDAAKLISNEFEDLLY